MGMADDELVNEWLRQRKSEDIGFEIFYDRIYNIYTAIWMRITTITNLDFFSSSFHFRTGLFPRET